MNRIKLYESAIKDLHDVKMKQVKVTISERITEIVLLVGTVAALCLGVGILASTPFF